jgi:hypothetical protein
MCPFYKSMCHTSAKSWQLITLWNVLGRGQLCLFCCHCKTFWLTQLVPKFLTGHNDLYRTHSIICNDFQLTFSAYFTVPLQGTMDGCFNPYWPTNCWKSTCPFCKSPRHCANREKHYNMECALGKYYSDVPGQRCDRNRQNTMSSKSLTDQEWRTLASSSLGCPFRGNASWGGRFQPWFPASASATHHIAAETTIANSSTHNSRLSRNLSIRCRLTAPFCYAARSSIDHGLL